MALKHSKMKVASILNIEVVKVIVIISMTTKNTTFVCRILILRQTWFLVIFALILQRHNMGPIIKI